MATRSAILTWKSVDGRAWRATVHGPAKSQTRLSTHTQCEWREYCSLHISIFSWPFIVFSGPAKLNICLGYNFLKAMSQTNILGINGIWFSREKKRISIWNHNMLGILGGKKVLHMCLLVLGRNWGFHSIETISLRNIMHAKLLQSFQTLCDPMDCSPPRLLRL